jgi:hypothetical protein
VACAIAAELAGVSGAATQRIKKFSGIYYSAISFSTYAANSGVSTVQTPLDHDNCIIPKGI